MPLYDYCCLNEHTTERYFSVAEKPFEIRCPKCKQGAQQVITYAPALHTLATFSQDISDRGVQATRDPGDGSYCDPNLFDRKTGKHPRITSRAQREQVMRDLGVQEIPPSDAARDVERDRSKRAKHFSAAGSRA